VENWVPFAIATKVHFAKNNSILSANSTKPLRCPRWGFALFSLKLFCTFQGFVDSIMRHTKLVKELQRKTLATVGGFVDSLGVFVPPLVFLGMKKAAIIGGCGTSDQVGPKLYYQANASGSSTSE